jgi:hypothetical protein
MSSRHLKNSMNSEVNSIDDDDDDDDDNVYDHFRFFM